MPNTDRPSTAGKITFGATLPIQDVDFENVKEYAQFCEKAGFDSVWCYDHFFPYDGTKPTQNFFECFTTLTALSMVTRRIRLGSLVACNNFRHPALVAKMSSQIDVLSNGRLDLGIGAGWFREEFDAYGYEFGDTNDRLGRLEEGLEIIKRMWLEHSPSFEGKYYRIKNAVNEPKPIQKPHPPIWMGGSLTRILRLTARYADGWNLGFYQSNTPEGFTKKNSTLNALCQNYGRNPAEIRRSWHGLLILGKNESDLERKAQQYKHLALGYPPIQATAETCEREIRKFTRVGVTDFFIRFPDPLDFETLQTFAERIIPTFAT